MKIPSDSRSMLANALLLYIDSHSERANVATEILNFVCNTPHCFERQYRKGHITGSAWLLHPCGTGALLTLHRQLKKWLQPGGHADGDPDTLRVALREAEEESGIAGIVPVSEEIFDVDIHEIPDCPAKNEPAHFHYDIRYLLRAPSATYQRSEESDDLAWWTWKQLTACAEELDPSLCRLADLTPPELRCEH